MEEDEAHDKEIEILGSFHRLTLPTYQYHACFAIGRHMKCSRCLHQLEKLGHYWVPKHLDLHKNLKHSCLLWIQMKLFVGLVGLEFLSNEIESSKHVP